MLVAMWVMLTLINGQVVVYSEAYETPITCQQAQHSIVLGELSKPYVKEVQTFCIIAEGREA